MNTHTQTYFEPPQYAYKRLEMQDHVVLQSVFGFAITLCIIASLFLFTMQA